MIKRRLQTLTKRLGFYHRLKASAIYDVYWFLADRRLVDARRKEVDFYKDFLRGFQPGSLIFDIGANDGTKTDFFLRLGAKVVAIEPDTVNQEVLRQKFLAFRAVKKPVTIVGKAVSDTCSVETMMVDPQCSWMNTLSSKWADCLAASPERFEQPVNFCQLKRVETTTLSHLIHTYGSPFFIKIDVEGYEVQVLRGLRHRVPYVSFEVNLPQFRQEGLECIRLLGTLDPEGKFNYAANLGTGLVSNWLAPTDFSSVFDQCNDKSIEIFWRAAKVFH